MIDVKKLITGFLILATAAGASGLILSFVSNFSVAAQAPAEAQLDAATSSTTPSVAANAFVDTGSLQGNAAEVLSDVDTTTTAAAASDPSNITNVFADSFLNGLVVANPSGVSTDASGTPQFAAPDTEAVAAAIATNPAVQDFIAPNWNTEASAQAIKTVAVNSPAAVSAYATSLDDIFNKYFVSTDLQAELSSQTGDPSNLTYAGAQVQGALSDTLALQVPSSLASFQKSLVKVMVYEKNLAQLSQVANDDPVKASLILQDEQTQYATAVSALQQQMQSATSVGLLFGKQEPSASVPLIAQLFGVQPAHAIFGVGDITFDPGVFGQLILTYTKDTVLQILKNTLISLIQRKVLTWVQGSGAPRFVTDWGSELVNSFQTAALNKINAEISCVPLNQQHVLKVLLTTPSISPGANINSCAAEFNGQLGNNLNNLSNLYNNFTNFNDYFQVLGPTGNTWSNLITIHDSALAAGSVSQTANTNQNVASQGFKGSQTCTDGSDPINGKHYWCEGGADPHVVDFCDDGSPYVNGGCESGSPDTALECNDGSVPELVANAGQCADGTSPKTTSPGEVTSQSMFSALQSGVQNITSANNIVGILNSLLTSLLNTLAQDAIDYSNQAVNGALTPDSGLKGITPASLNTTTGSVTPSPTQCLPSVQSISLSTSTFQANATLYSSGGAIDTTCASGGFCPSTENPDGTPIYNWSAPGSAQYTNTTALTGTPLNLTYTSPGQYFATVTASTDNTTSSCEIDVQ